MKLLHVDSSILGAGSVSRQLTADIVAAERMRHPGIEVVYRDVAAVPLDHLTAPVFAGLRGEAPSTDDQQRDLTAAQAILAEFLEADIVVVGAPMYNFGVPSQLKAWIDRLAVAGKTFRYSEKGSEGLAGGKKVIIASSRGGFYGPDTAAAFMDHQEAYLRGVFGFFGITDVVFIRAEGLALGAEQRAKALEAAKSEIGGLAA